MASKEEGVESRSMEVSCDEKLVVEKQKMEESEELEGLKQRGPVSIRIAVLCTALAQSVS